MKAFCTLVNDQEVANPFKSLEIRYPRIIPPFGQHPRLWLTSLGLSFIIGAALMISTQSSSKGSTKLDGWQIFRLFLMPFCVSSFAALVKDAGYVLIFPPTLRENLIGLVLIGVFSGLVLALKKSRFAANA